MKLKIEFNDACEAQAKAVANFLVELAQAKSGVVTPNKIKMIPRSEMVQEPVKAAEKPLKKIEKPKVVKPAPVKTAEKVDDGAPTLHEIREMLKLKAKTKKQEILIELKRLKTKSLTAMDKADYPNFFTFLQQL
jgi:hypothetical protein